jgi:hypothetical protein
MATRVMNAALQCPADVVLDDCVANTVKDHP